jgi:hypothetical protein
MLEEVEISVGSVHSILHKDLSILGSQKMLSIIWRLCGIFHIPRTCHHLSCSCFHDHKVFWKDNNLWALRKSLQKEWEHWQKYQIIICRNTSKGSLCGLVVRVCGYRTEMYCVSCEVWTEFIYVMLKKVDRLCGLVIRVPGYRSRGPGSIPSTNRFSEK